MASDEKLSECLNDLADYHATEQILMDKNNHEEGTDLDRRFRDLIPDYMPFGANGPRITLLSSVPLMDRYRTPLLGIAKREI